MREYYFIALMIFLLFIFSGCRRDNLVEVEGYTLHIIDENNVAIAYLPEDVLELTQWTIPEKIGDYEINTFGYARNSLWGGTSLYPGTMGKIKALTVPKSIKTINCSLNGVRYIKTEGDLFDINFYDFERITYYPTYYNTPLRDENVKINYVSDDNIYNDMIYEVSDEGANILLYFGDDDFIEIPDEINGHMVTEIEDYAFLDSKLNSINFSNNLNKIGNYSFYNNELEYLVIPDNVVSIGESAFSNSKILETVYLGNGLTEISSSLFTGSLLLKEVRLPNNLLTIGSSAFSLCNIELIDIPNSVENIGSYAFSHNPLKKLILPRNLDVLYNIVDGCYALEEIYINEFLTRFSLDNGSFSNNLKIIEVDSNNKRFKIKDGILYNINLTHIYLCPSLNEIKEIVINVTANEAAFKNVQNLEYVEINTKYDDIPERMFESCLNLKTVVLSENITKIGFAAFRDCNSLENINLNYVEEIENSSFHNCINLKEVNLDNAKYIKQWSFNNSGITGKIQFSENLEKIYDGAFIDCKNITEISFANPNTIIESAFVRCSNLNKVTLPSNITQIYRSTFYGCSLKEIYIPKTVTYVGAHAFSNVTLHFKGTELKQTEYLSGTGLEKDFNVGGKYHFNCKHN